MATKQNIFVFSGRDTLRRSTKVSKWIEVFVAKYGDAGLSRLSATSSNPETIKAELLALPFLVEKRLVIVDDALIEKGEKPTEEKKRIGTTIAACLEEISDSTFAVFTGSAPEESGELFTKLQEIAKIESIDPLRGETLFRALMDEFPTLGIKNARKFVERCSGEDVDSTAYIEKLRLFSDESIKNEEIIDEILPPTEEYNAFALSDAVLAFQTKKALSLVESMIKTRDIRTEIFIPLTEWLRTALYIAKSRNAGLTDAQIAKEMGIHPFVLTKRPRWNRKQYETILSVFETLVQTETEGKTGEMPGYDDEERLLFGISRSIFRLENLNSVVQSSR